MKLAWSSVFSFCIVYIPKNLILSLEQKNARSNFHSVFVSFILYVCIKLITNKLQSLPRKVSRKFSVGCDNYLIILVQHGASISHVCLFKIHGTVANWVVSQIKLKPNLMQYFLFYKIDGCVK